MAYIGNTPADSYISLAVQHFTVSATTSYTLDQSVTNSHDIALFINNVRQEPGSGYAYTASGGTLTLSAPTATTDTMYCVFLGKSIGTIAPPADSIGTSAIADAAITDAKIGTVGASKITGTVADSQIAGMAASKLTGTVTNAQIADLDAAKLTGTVADARFPATLPASSGANLTGLTAGNITGVIPAANLGTGTANATTFLNGSGAYSEAGGGAWNHLSTVSVSGASTAFEGLNAYDTYVAVFSHISVNVAGANADITMQTGYGATPTYLTSSYKYHNSLLTTASNSYASTRSQSASGMLIAQSAKEDSNRGVDGYVFIHSNTAWAIRFIGQITSYYQSDNEEIGSTLFGFSASSADPQITAIKFITSTGAFDAGKISIYGLSQS